MTNDSAGLQPVQRLTPASERRAQLRIELGDGFFLSTSNPTATLDQRDIEARAIELMKLPEIQRAKAMAMNRFRLLADHDMPEEAWPIFDDVMSEWAFHYVLLALNSDPNYPKVLGHWFGPPHQWFGMDVPGSRGPATAENTDNNYSVIPVDGNSRFEIIGRRFAPAVGDCPMQVTTNLSQSMNVGSVDWREVCFDDDGSFVITVGPTPNPDSRNHLQTTLDTRYIFIRDGRMDWRQVPNGYRVVRLDSPFAAPRTEAEIVGLASRFIIDDVGPMNFFRRMVCACKPNVLPPIVSSGDVGGMPSQKLLVGRLKLEADEAFVMTIGLEGAGYFTLGSYNSWMMSGDFWSHTSTLNNTQSIPNADGSYTFVFSSNDPGVHNWIDTLGLREPLLMARWHLLPKEKSAAEQWAKGEKLKLSALASALPAQTAWITPEQRREQQQDRLSTFKARYIV